MHEWLFYRFIFNESFEMSYITAIETAVPEYGFTQETFTGFYLNSTTDDTDKRKINIVSKKSGIDKRYSVIKDYGKNPSEFEFFPKTASLSPEPSLTQRMVLYKAHAAKLSANAIRKIKNFESIKHTITHLITVTCTGLFAPGLDIELMRELNLNPTTHRSSINFMGCNAAIIALKQADAICNSDPDANVLIVCTELCTLHFQKQYNDDYILSNLIFADGSAAIIVSGQESLHYYNQAIEIARFDSLIIHNGYKDMAWQLSETGFLMNLTSYVSGLIKDNIKPLLDSIGLKASDIDYWAIHPGGKRIIDDFEDALGLEASELKHSYDVLKNYGNMSSPTVLFVLKQLLENTVSPKKGDRIFTAAFGPGLSVETMQLQYV